MSMGTVDRIPALQAERRTAPPAWAVLERRLIAAMDEAAPVFLEKYTRPGGALIWQEEYPGDGVWADDLYEAFFNWPHYYALGGSEYCGEHALNEWNAITRQLAVDYGRVTDEFVNDDDWFHNAENYIYFYALGMVDPTVRDNVARARRFAGFYTGANPAVPNYDPAARVIRSPFSGSKGPLFHARWADVRYNLEYGHVTLGPGPSLPESWWEDAELRRKVHQRFDHVVMHSDVIVNLGTVPLAAAAFLYTGDASYRQWIVDYVGAWMERTRANGGIIPDNIGPGGVAGERRDGQWWGGHYGWTGRYGHQMIGSALTVAAEAAQLVTGDPSYLDLVRMWLDLLADQGIRDEQGCLLVPHNYTGEAGWTNHQLVHPHPPIHLWAASMDPADRERVERFRAGDEAAWATVTSRGPRVPDDRAWTRWLAGDLPSYPEQILQANYQEVCRRLEQVMADEQDLTKIDVHHWQQVNPVHTEALVHLTTGGPQTVYWGGLATGRLRYYDGQRQRPGLPQDVGALVRSLAADSATVTLVNLSVRHAREVIVGAGSFGEHEFVAARVLDAPETPDTLDTSDTPVVPGTQNPQNPLPVQGPWLRVLLPPGTEIDLELGMRRFARTPSYAFPWHTDGIPIR